MLFFPERFTTFWDLQLHEFEGGFANDKNDKGRETIYGISSGANKDLAQKIRTRTLTVLEAKTRAFNRYYLAIPNIEFLPDGIGFIIYDAYFHGAIDVYTRHIQLALNNVLAGLGLPTLRVDGTFGEDTSSVIVALGRRVEPYLIDFLAEHSTELLVGSGKNWRHYKENWGSRIRKRVLFARALRELQLGHA